MDDGDYRIYRYDFTDGSAYIGRTRQTLAARHTAHRCRPVNRYLYHQLHKHPDVRPVLIGSYPTLSEAVAAERAALASLERPLNAVWISTTRFVPEGMSRLADDDPVVWALKGRDVRGKTKIRNRRYPRVETGSYRCRTCYEHKPPQDFNADTLRSTGIASRCRSCQSHVGKMYRLYRLAGRPQYEAYESAVAAIRDGTIAAALDEATEAAMANGYRPRPYRYRMSDGLVLCLGCGAHKPPSEFHRRIGGCLGLTPQCKTCRNVLNKAMSQAKRDGTSTSEAYQQAKAELAATTAETI